MKTVSHMIQDCALEVEDAQVFLTRSLEGKKRKWSGCLPNELVQLTYTEVLTIVCIISFAMLPSH